MELIYLPGILLFLLPLNQPGAHHKKILNVTTEEKFLVPGIGTPGYFSCVAPVYTQFATQLFSKSQETGEEKNSISF